MNILLWVLQILLAFWNFTGGIYEAFHYENLKGAWANALPTPVWIAYGVLQALFALSLVLPWRKLTPIAAASLTVLSLLGCVLFAKYAGFPGILWGLVPSILSVFVLYGRKVLKPF
jgi:hypothetical protein